METNKALDLLRQVRTIHYNGVSYDREPNFSDFYKPSKQMKNYQYLVMGGVGVGTGLVLHTMI